MLTNSQVNHYTMDQHSSEKQMVISASLALAGLIRFVKGVIEICEES